MEPRMFDTFAHINLGKGRATLAIRVIDDSVEVGVSFCSLKDQFSRARGRELAKGRLNARRGFYCATKRDLSVALKEQVEAMVRELVSSGKLAVQNPKTNKPHRVPNWALRGARKMTRDTISVNDLMRLGLAPDAE